MTGAMEGQTYKRTVSADDSGFQYELKMTALAAMRLYNLADEFYLANNFDAGEKFDDLVFAADIQGQWTTWFVQLKHKQKSSLASRKITLASIVQETKANKSDYNLIKYFDSYKAIGMKFNPGSNDVIFGRDYSGARFLIFTNALLGDDLIAKDFLKVKLPVLSTNPTKELNLKFDTKKDSTMFKTVHEKALLNDFLNKLTLCSNQACEDALDALLNEEIGRASPDLSAVEINYVNGQMKDYIRRWYKCKEYLTKANVRDLLLKTSIETQAVTKNEVSIKLLPSFLKQVSLNLRKEPIMNYISKAANVLICEAALRQLDFLNEPNVYTNVKQLQNDDFRGMLLKKWKELNNISLIINTECDVVQIDLKSIGDFITELSKICVKNCIILLSTDGNERAQKLAVQVAAKRRNFTCTLINVHEDSKVGLMGSPVLFQGHETSLSSLMPSNKMLDQVLGMGTISDLLRGQMAQIGLKPIESISYYITRVLIRNCIVPKIFESCRSGTMLALSGLTVDLAKEKLPQFADLIQSSVQVMGSPHTDAKIIVLENNTFDQVSAKLGAMHWLEKHKNLWAWKRSSGNVEDIMQFNSHIWDFTPTDNIMKIQDKVVLVIAEPGMGKSTLLVHMAGETKRLNPHMWVVLVTLNDFTDRMASDDFLRNIDSNVKAIVAEAAGISSETSKFNTRLFDHCYDVTGKMIILLDGFDEITPYYTKEGLALVKALQNSKIERVWVTARPIMRDLLQKATNIVPYNIKAFTAKDQKEFLTKFWRKSIDDITVERLNEFIDKVLSLVGASMDGESDDFYGIPLQTRMLAEAFEKELRVYHDTGVLTLPSKINRLQLFEAFVGKKLSILDEKAKVVASNAVSRNQVQVWRKTQESRLMKLALLTMFNQEQCARICPPLLPFEIIKLKDEVANGEEKTGIVVSYKGEVPQFIHRTFAEYFVARFFEAYSKQNLQFFTSDAYCSSSLNLVKYFLDHLLAKGHPLHEAVLNQNVDELKLLLEGKSTDINAPDKGGRTALHLAAMQSDAEAVIRLLLEFGADTSKVDDIFKWTAMEFAMKSRDVGNMAPLIQQQHFANLPRDILPIDWQTFKKSMEGDYLNLFMGLLENGIVSSIGVDVLPLKPWVDDRVVEGMTYLHLAAAYNATSILQYLLRNDTRDSKLWLMERVNGDGDTALLIAASKRHAESVLLLLKAGANILATTAIGKNIVDIIVENYDTNMLPEILMKLNENKQFVPEQFLIGAVTTLAGNRKSWASAALQLFLMSYPGLLNCTTKREMPLIAIAVSKANEVAVQVMCLLGVDVNQTVKGGSLLHLAIDRGSKPTLSLLLECAGIMIDKQDALGQTPLFLATKSGYMDMVKILLKREANPHCLTHNESTLAHAAAYSRSAPTISHILRLDIDFNTRNRDGESALSILESAGQNALVELVQSFYRSKLSESDEAVKSVQETVELCEQPQPLLTPEVVNGNGSGQAPARKKKNKKVPANTIVGPPAIHNNSDGSVSTQALPAQTCKPSQPVAKKVKPPRKKKKAPNQQSAQGNAPDYSLLLNLMRDMPGQLTVDKLAMMLQEKALTSNQPKKVSSNPVPGSSNPAQKKKKPNNQAKVTQVPAQAPPSTQKHPANHGNPTKKASQKANQTKMDSKIKVSNNPPVQKSNAAPPKA